MATEMDSETRRHAETWRDFTKVLGYAMAGVAVVLLLLLATVV